jgi:hypothetical protein
MTSVRSESFVVRASYTDFGDLWSPFPMGVGPAGALCKALDIERQAVLKDALRRNLAIGDDDSPFELSARAWAARGAVNR